MATIARAFPDGSHPARAREQADAGPPARWLVPLLALQLALALVMATTKSLVQDELHTLFHASAPDLATLLSRLRQDNHPPAGFLAVRVARALLGDGELALRSPEILFGLGTTWLIARIGARAGVPALLGAALWALSSTQLEFSTQVRMYSLSALCSAGAIDAWQRFFEEERAGPRRAAGLALAAWVALGLHTHYYWVLYSAALVAATLLGAVAQGEHRAKLRPALPWGVLALACVLPWYLAALPAQATAGLPPGMTRSGPLDWIESYVHLLMWNLRLGGPVLRWVFAAAGALATVLALLGAARLARGPRRAQGFVLAALAFGVPAVAAALAATGLRSGFNWNYVVPSAPPFAVLVAACAGAGAWQRLVARALLAPIFALGVLNAFSVGTQDQRGAVLSVLERWRPGDAVICVEIQGPVFGQGLAWDYYAPRLARQLGLPLPERLPARGDFDAADPGSVLGHPRIFVTDTGVGGRSGLLARLRAGYEVHALEPFGLGLDVHLFERPITTGD